MSANGGSRGGRPAGRSNDSSRTPKPAKSRRIGKRVAALSSAAILAVYAAGYARTQATDQQIVGAEPTVSPVTTSTPTTISGYRDGTYVGLGKSRHGNIEATVTISGGRIISTAITRCMTRYSCSWIEGLPAQVVARQSAKVDRVSGASDSSKAFVNAVNAALKQAA